MTAITWRCRMVYWGKRSGSIHPVHGPIIRGKRAATGRKEHQGPHGYQLKHYWRRLLAANSERKKRK